MARAAVAVILVATLASAGCGTTQIVSTEPGAHIYVDGRSAGKGRAEVTRRGLPGSSVVIVKTDDGRREEQVIRRSFTLTTFVLGLFTYFVCFAACWEYPDTVVVALPSAQGFGAAPGVDPWLQPPPGWQPK